MIEFFRNWIMNIVVIIILLIFIEIIIPSDKFKKHIKLVSGLILMIAIINPIVSLVDESYSIDKITIQSFNSFEKDKLKNKADKLGSLQNSQIISVYKDKLNKQVKNKIVSMDKIKDAEVNVKVDKDTKSKEFGSILNIKATISVKNTSQHKSQIIEEVDVSLDESEKKPSIKLINSVKKELSQIYKISPDKISITTR